jgi:hypothetical protein
VRYPLIGFAAGIVGGWAVTQIAFARWGKRYAKLYHFK